jgi:hypothetical protein
MDNKSSDGTTRLTALFAVLRAQGTNLALPNLPRSKLGSMAHFLRVFHTVIGKIVSKTNMNRASVIVQNSQPDLWPAGVPNRTHSHEKALAGRQVQASS